jgi:putative FmdB family regulatory protein
MPIYEYQCRECSHRFEAIVRVNDPAPACPSCQSANPERLISLFAVDAPGTRNKSLSDSENEREGDQRQDVGRFRVRQEAPK